MTKCVGDKKAINFATLECILKKSHVQIHSHTGHINMAFPQCVIFVSPQNTKISTCITANVAS